MQQLSESPSLTRVPPAVLTAEMQESLKELDELHGLSEATRRAYTHDWQAFEAWCQANTYPAMPCPGNVLAAYCNERAKQGTAYAYICRSVAAISQLHKRAKLPNPRQTEEVRRTLRNIAHRDGMAQRQVAPLMLEDIRRMLGADDETTLHARRNKALILTGYLGAFRRSEVAGLTRNQLNFSKEGVDILLARSKTDRRGKGRIVSIPYCQQADICAVRALLAWLLSLDQYLGTVSCEWVFPAIRKGCMWTNDPVIAQKPIDGRDVARIIKAMCERAGLPPEHYSGHSLRAGLATQAARDGVSDKTIQKQTGHASTDGVFQRYIRAGNRWTENVVKEMGL